MLIELHSTCHLYFLSVLLALPNMEDYPQIDIKTPTSKSTRSMSVLLTK